MFREREGYGESITNRQTTTSINTPVRTSGHAADKPVFFYHQLSSVTVLYGTEITGGNWAYRRDSR
jgi:hypothetical protein